MTTAKQLQDLLGLRVPPVALTFRDTPPPNIPRVVTPSPSGCTYWKLAAEGQTFYTEAEDHYQCPIGAYTHHVELPPEQSKELESVVGTMIQLGYLRPEEVPNIPRLQGSFRIAVYGPVGTNGAPAPDVVLVRGNAKQMMLLAEAALAAGIGAESPMMGRPTCAAVPEVLRTQRSAASLGCIGNRVYTGLADDELYFALPGKQIGVVAEKLAEIMNANRKLEEYHHAKLAQAGGKR